MTEFFLGKVAGLKFETLLKINVSIFIFIKLIFYENHLTRTLLLTSRVRVSIAQRLFHFAGDY